MATPDHTRSLRFWSILLFVSIVITCAGDARGQTCPLRTTYQVPELEFWGPWVEDLNVESRLAPVPGGRRVRYTTAYPGTGSAWPLVVFLHGGFPGQLEVYCELLLHVATHGYFVLFVEKSPAATTPADYARDARIAVNHVVSGGDGTIARKLIAPPESASGWTVAGHSWGAATAFFVAADERFSRVISLEPMEGRRTFGDPRLTAGAEGVLASFSGDLFIVTGTADHLTPPVIGAEWFRLAKKARRRVLWTVEGAGHYGPMSLPLAVGDGDPVQPWVQLPDTLDFPTQLRVHKRIVLGALLSRDPASAHLMPHLFGPGMELQDDSAGGPFHVDMRTSCPEPLAWIAADGGVLRSGVHATEGDYVLFQWRFAQQPWNSVIDAEALTPLGRRARRDVSALIPLGVLGGIDVRGAVLRRNRWLLTGTMSAHRALNRAGP